jgi:hypothetical protein
MQGMWLSNQTRKSSFRVPAWYLLHQPLSPLLSALQRLHMQAALTATTTNHSMHQLHHCLLLLLLLLLQGGTGWQGEVAD